MQLRRLLTVAKRQKVPFDEAWASAVRRTYFGHDKAQRHDWYAVVEDLRPTFEAAYNDQDVVGGRAAIRLMESLARDSGKFELPPVRTPPPIAISRHQAA